MSSGGSAESLSIAGQVRSKCSSLCAATATTTAAAAAAAAAVIAAAALADAVVAV